MLIGISTHDVGTETWEYLYEQVDSIAVHRILSCRISGPNNPANYNGI
jgi:hypothetical protein